MRSERKCSISDLLWPDPSIPKGESEKFVFIENNNIFEGKKYTAFLVFICGKPTGQNTAGSFLINFTCHAIKRRRHSIERDVDLHVVIEKKMQILFDWSKRIIIEICR